MTDSKNLNRKRGSSLGPAYHYEWNDAEPTATTWADLADQRETFGFIAGVIVAPAVC